MGFLGWFQGGSYGHYVGEIAGAAQPGTMVVFVGDHPIHAGQFKRTHDPYYVALIIGGKDPGKVDEK